MVSASRRSATKWMCDFCIAAAYYDTHDEAEEHERHCEARTGRVKTTISYQNGKTLGLILAEAREDKDDKSQLEISTNSLQNVVVSAESIIFGFVKHIHAGANALFLPDNECDPYEHWENMDSSYLDNLIDFGRKNLPPALLCHLCMINDGSLKAALTGKIRPGDIIQDIEYNEGYNEGYKMKTLRLANSWEKNLKLKAVSVLQCPECHPVKLTIQRGVTAESTMQSDNPLRDRQNLDLNDNIFVRHAEWSRLLNGLSKLHLLTELHLDKNGIGRNGCVALASLLKKKDSSPRWLSLRQNNIDDECTSVLAGALKSNDTLEGLNLDRNDGITSVGWNHMLKLVCDKTSIDSTYLSNHKLNNLGVNLDELAQSSRDFSDIPYQLEKFLLFNRPGYGFPAFRKKIMHVHFNGDPFDLQPILDMDVRIMPHLLLWFMEKSDSCKIRCSYNLYHLIRNWNIPFLSGFPSAERMRIGSQVTHLETRNADLEALVLKLKAENRKLKEENEAYNNKKSEFKEANEGTKGENDNLDSLHCLKRRRRS